MNSGGERRRRNTLRPEYRGKPDLVRLARTARGCSPRSRLAAELASRAAVAALPEVPEKASEFVNETLGVALDPWQAEFVDDPGQRKALLGARQCGKSTAVAGMVVHRMLTRPETKVVVVAASGRQSGLLVEKCKWMLRQLGIHRFEAGGSVALGNGSTLVGLPCKASTIRGFTADLLVLDEAAQIPDVVYAAARPMLAATRGDVVVASSAHEPVGFFWELMTQERGVGWAKRVVRARDVSRFDPKFLAEERRELGEDVYSREYECEFGDASQGMFKRKLVERALKDDVEPLFKKG